MFIEAYGAGEIVRLATARGFIVASPRTEQVSDAAAFAALLAAIKRDYTVDEDRIYVLGHSMGAMATAAIATREASRIAAAACIAGGFNAAPKSTPAPTLVIGAELDSIVGPARLKKVAEAAAAAGQPVSYEAVTGYGHTLVVEHSLPRALEFLFAHKRGEAAAHKPADDAMPVAPAAK